MTLHPGIKDCDFLISIGTQLSPEEYINRSTITVKYQDEKYVVIHHTGEYYHMMTIDSVEPAGTAAFIKIVLRRLLYQIEDAAMRDIVAQVLTLDNAGLIDLSRQLGDMSELFETLGESKGAKEKREVLIRESAEVVGDWLVFIKIPYESDYLSVGDG